MSNLLDKASIILTPTAYNNGEALCVKPSDGSGDFDFSRNSAATRVNAQGLVENVQILSSNLVQNPSFSEEGVQEVSNGSFSQEGVQLVTNGSFSTDTDWTKGTGWSISGGSANCDGTQTAGTQLEQNGTYTINKVYKITYTISVTAGTVDVRLKLGGTLVTGAVQTASGTYTEYLTSTGNTAFAVRGNIDFIGSIDNVSVREVGQDWTLGTGWSIGEDKAVCDGSQSTISDLTQTLSTPSGKSYKVTYTISEYTSGSIFVRLNSGNITASQSSVGTFTEYISGEGGTQVSLRADANFNGSITNISVKEVGQNWTLQTGWSIADGKASAVASTQAAYQSGVTLAVGNKYLCSFEITDYTSGQIVFACGSGGLGTNRSANGVYTEVIVAGTGNIILLDGIGGTGAFTGSITNISVIEITTDTSLPRINYEGFSYQDALGSELITNGSFDTDSNWTTLGGWNISDGSANCNGGSIMFTNGSIAANKTYKVTYTVSEFVSGGVKVRLNGTPDTDGLVRTSNGTYTEYITSSSSVNGNFSLAAVVSFTGSIDNVSVKEYLGQEVVPDSGCGSWLWEPQSTNLITQSELFSDAVWTKSNASVTSGFSSPDGTTNAFELNIPSSNGYLLTQLFSYSAVSGQSVTASIFAKNEITNFLTFGGATVSGTDVYSIQDYGNGWFRHIATRTFTTTATGGVQFIIFDQVGNNVIWGAMIEALSYATSYIPTSGSTVTRNQDLCTNGGSLASINSTEGVLYAEIAALANDGTLRMIVLNDGTQSNRVGLQYSSTNNLITAAYDIGGAGQASLSYTLTDAKSFNKIAFKYKQNDFSLYVNGIEVATDVSGNVLPANTLNNFEFEYGDNRFFFFGKTKAVAVWKEALSDSELQSLTTI